MNSRSRARAYDPLKRVIDVVIAVVLLAVTAPLQIMVAALVAMKLGRPVLFKQRRPGKDAKSFTLLKFRSMLNEDSSRGLVTNEQRMTPFGKILRSTSLDELPSLWNVLRGEMSLVGPRPLLIDYLPRYTQQQARRHEVRPGVTGLAQVNGRNTLNWERRLRLDVHYVDNRSLRLDVGISVLTILKVLQRDGIASEGEIVGIRFTGTADESRA